RRAWPRARTACRWPPASRSPTSASRFSRPPRPTSTKRSPAEAEPQVSGSALLSRLRTRDRGFVALRRATRTAIVMPSMFALGAVVIDNPTLATFAAFGSFALLLLVDFAGPMRRRLQAQAALALTGAVFVCVGTLASRSPWLAAVAMAV